MERILVIGCPGSGKSTLSKLLAKRLNYPLLHLDRIYHIDNFNQITRDELKQKINQFVLSNDKFIIDGNYLGTLDYRMKYADTIILLDFKTDICLENVVRRTKSSKIRDDIAPGFDNSIIDPEFIEYVTNFNKLKLPKIYDVLNDFHGEIIIIKSYEEMDVFLRTIS